MLRQHPVTPPAILLAVATLLHVSLSTAALRAGDWVALLVSQPGAVSVANPEDNSIPEEVIVRVRPTSSSGYLQRGSRRVILGDTVLDWDGDYRQMGELMVVAAERFLAAVGDVNGDGALGVSDPVYLLRYMFQGETRPGPRLRRVSG